MAFIFVHSRRTTSGQIEFVLKRSLGHFVLVKSPQMHDMNVLLLAQCVHSMFYARAWALLSCNSGQGTPASRSPGSGSHAAAIMPAPGPPESPESVSPTCSSEATCPPISQDSFHSSLLCEYHPSSKRGSFTYLFV